MFNTQLSSSKLSTIARMALAEWDRELQQQQRQQQQQQQQAGVGDMAEREQALQQQQQQPSHPALLQPTTPRSARKRPRTAPDPDQDPDRDHQLHLGPDPDYQPQGQGNGSAPVLLLQPRHVIAGCQSLRAADSMVRSPWYAVHGTQSMACMAAGMEKKASTCTGAMMDMRACTHTLTYTHIHTQDDIPCSLLLRVIQCNKTAWVHVCANNAAWCSNTNLSTNPLQFIA
eukprot:1160561-Pelagomonas_calceolata.AAC.2